MSSDETTVSSASNPDGSPSPQSEGMAAPARRTRRRAASRPAGPPQPTSGQPAAAEPAPQPSAEGAEPVAKRASTRRASKKTADSAPSATTAEASAASSDLAPIPSGGPGTETPAKKASTRKRANKAAVASPFVGESADAPPTEAASDDRPVAVSSPVFQAPDPSAAAQVSDSREQTPTSDGSSGDGGEQSTSGTSTSTRRRRSRGGRNRRKSADPAGAESGTTSDGEGAGAFADEGSATSSVSDQAKPPKTAKESTAKKSSTKESTAKKTSGKEPSSKKTSGRTSADGSDESAASDEDAESKDSDEGGTSSSSRRRRRRRRSGDGPSDGAGDSAATVVKVRESRPASDSITSVEGSTRIEAKKQRRREGREAGRRRAPILSESEFLARRESVERVMVIRQRDDVTQIAVLEDNVLVEHYVALEQQNSLLGNAYLGRVQNVLPSMEAAFIDIGKGRNAVLYAGEVNWDLIGDRNQPRRIEHALKSGQQILVQVSKDPVGHKGARLTSQISLPGRYLVYVPGGGSSGISRKLPDTERNRLKNLLKDILPDESGVIIRTAAEGASEEELTRDVRRLTSRWEEIEKLVKTDKAPALLYAEPDITLKVVRDLFTEDFATLVVSGDQAWETVHDYVSYVAPDLTERLERYDGNGDVFDNYRVDEQIAKALERKVWLPSGGSLVIDRTEAMTVIDVNTGKFTGSGGNLEQTVTKNNLEAAEETVRQLRLRDIGGIIVIDFIDMVLENNRDLVLRRLVECLGRDRTRHQVAEVTSLGLVQMTRKRIGTGLVESFSVPCETCHGRGVIIEAEPVRGRSDEPAVSSSGRTTSKRSSGRRSAKSEPEAEQVDPQAAERHSAAAAATAAIAAALHPEMRTEGAQSGLSVPADESEGAVGDVTAATTPAKKVTAKKSTTKKAPAAKKTTAKKTTAKKTTAKKTTAKNSTAKDSTATKSAAKKTTAKKSVAEQVSVNAEPVGASP